MIENAYFLLLLLLIPFYLRRKSSCCFKHPHVAIFPKSGFQISWQAFMLAGLTALVLASCNISLKYKEFSKVSLVHKYVLVNDASGSMIDNKKDNGIGRDMQAVIAGNRKLLSMLGNRTDGTKDLCGLIIFSSDSYVVSYLVEDVEFIYKKLTRIDYREAPLNQGTNLQAALWSGIEMILSYGKVMDEDLDRLVLRFYGNGTKIRVDAFTDRVIANKDSFKGASIIVFTDGFFSTPEGSNNIMSAYKLIEFCKLAGIRVYFVSVAVMANDLAQLCIESGGGVYIINNLENTGLEKIYQSIIESQTNEYVTKEVEKDHSLTDILGFLGFILVIFGLLLHTTKQLKYTEV